MVIFKYRFFLKKMELQKTFSLYWATLLYMRLEKPSMKDIWYGSMTLSLWYFKNTTAQLYDPTNNPEEAEVDWFYEDLQDLLELTLKKYVLFIIGEWNTKVGSQETSGVTGKSALECRMKQGKD